MEEKIRNLLPIDIIHNFTILCRTKDIPIPTILKELEYCILKLNICEENKNILRAQTTNIITYFRNKKGNGSHHYSSVLNDFITTNKSLNANEDFLVMRSDKGGSTVMMRRDEESHQMLTDFLTKRYQYVANKLISELKQNKIINEYAERLLKIHDAVPPIIYGLRKTHKNILCSIPVVSSINATSHNLTTLVHNILSLTNTFEFSMKTLSLLWNPPER